MCALVYLYVCISESVAVKVYWWVAKSVSLFRFILLDYDDDGVQQVSKLPLNLAHDTKGNCTIGNNKLTNNNNSNNSILPQSKKYKCICCLCSSNGDCGGGSGSGVSEGAALDVGITPVEQTVPKSKKSSRQPLNYSKIMKNESAEPQCVYLGTVRRFSIDRHTYLGKP